MRKAILSELTSREKVKALILRIGHLFLEALLAVLVFLGLPLFLLIGLLVHILFKIDNSFSFSIKIETPKRNIYKKKAQKDVIDIIADVVYEDDEIEIEKDQHGRLYLKKHKTNPFKKSKDKIIGAYAFVYYKADGQVVSNGIAMSAEEIEEDFRSLSKADKSMGKNSFWEKFKVDMYKKTVIKQLRKVLPPLPEERLNMYHQKVSDIEDIETQEKISPERQSLIKQFNQAYINSGLTAPELKSIIFTRYFVNEPAQLTDEQLKEMTKLLKEKGRALLEATVLIGAKEQKQLDELFREKQLKEEQEAKVKEYLGIDPDKIPNQEEYELLKSFLTENTKEQILEIIGWEEEKKQFSLEEALDNT